jgi:endoglucanase
MKHLRKLLLAAPLALLLLAAACSAQDTADIDQELTALELVRLMGNGINLGNTMEACNSSERIPNRDPSVYETMWGQPVTTQEMITGMKEAGFKTLRIPVAWTNAMDFENNDYKINKAYLDRVEEIVNYALNEDMYVIINDHWDHGWWSLFSHPEAAEREKAMKIFTEMWKQISERFKKYDVRLIFEPANEEWGNRFNDKTPFNPTGGSMEQDECYLLLTELAQVFVDLVRDTGGNNAYRFLLIPGYNTDVAMTVDDRFRMPDDRIADRLLLSVHYYTPWSYCGDTSGVGSWGRTSEVEEMNSLLGSLTKFTELGYGVILGEWGVLDNHGDDRLTYFTNFLDNCDKYGYVSMLWNTSGFYDKETCRMFDRELEDLYKERSLTARADQTLDDILAYADFSMKRILRLSADRVETILSADEAFAWIMFSSGDWSVQYSVGDNYQPEAIADGLVATDVEVTAGAGTYTVGLDFTGLPAGYADGISFSAVGIMNGEIIFPGYLIVFTEVLINGEEAVLSGEPYTTNDNPVTTRVNLFNEWVNDATKVAEARTPSGDMSKATPTPFSNYKDTQIKTLSITFDYLPAD